MSPKDFYKMTIPAAALGRFAVGSKGYFNDIFGPLSSCSIYANDIESWPKPLAYSFTVKTVNVCRKIISFSWKGNNEPEMADL